MSKSTSLDLSIVPPENTDPAIVPLSKLELFEESPSADELLIVISVATTFSIVPWKAVLDITPSVNVESSMVEFVSTTLFPVPSLNSEFVNILLFPVPSLNSEFVIIVLLTVPSRKAEALIVP